MTRDLCSRRNVGSWGERNAGVVASFVNAPPEPTRRTVVEKFLFLLSFVLVTSVRDGPCASRWPTLLQTQSPNRCVHAHRSVAVDDRLGLVRLL